MDSSDEHEALPRTFAGANLAPAMSKRKSTHGPFIGLAVTALPAAAHHSLAGYDVDQSVHFEGVVETMRMDNPHIALTLTVTKDDGTRGTITFVEGAPANVLERRGLAAADIAVGKPIKAIGAPRRDEPNLYFLKTIILPDGRRFTFVE
jgi:hypothetical protein